MATVASLQTRHDAIVAQYEDNKAFVLEVQTHAVEDLIPVLEEELELQPEDIARALAFLEDPVTIFRFCRRARFALPASLALIHATLSFRLVSSLSNLSPVHLAPLYLTQPVFFFHPDLSDRFGRPCAVLNLKYVTRTEDGELDGLKEFVRVSWEVGRRWMADLSKGKGKEGSEVKVQMVVIVDLDGAGMTNLEVEMLPFFMDLLKSHFPGMVGAIFVLNYGWMYAGMWQLAKRILPNTALERILFPTKAELLQFFEEKHLLIEHGGTVSYEYTPANPILDKYCRPSQPGLSSATYPSRSPSPMASPLLRTLSLESLSDIFHSVTATPLVTRPPTPSSGASISRRPSGLNMTALNRASTIGVMTPRTPIEGVTPVWRNASSSSLRRISSLVDFQLHLAETQAAIQSDSSGDEDEDEAAGREIAAREYARQMSEAVLRNQQAVLSRQYEDEGETPIASTSNSVQSSRATSRATSRNVSVAVSRQTSPLRREEGSGDHEIYSSRAVKFSGSQHISPYNVSNPYYGYPAYVATTSIDPSGIPRPHFSRRRKRDLVRTLTYLAALRFFALHRQIKWHIGILIRAMLTITGLRKVGHIRSSLVKKKKSIRWEAGDGDAGALLSRRDGNLRSALSSNTTPMPSPPTVRGVRFVYALLLLVLLRSSLLYNLANLVFVATPKRIIPTGWLNRNALKDCEVIQAGLGRNLSAVRRKRDVIKSFFGIGLKLL